MKEMKKKDSLKIGNFFLSTYKGSFALENTRQNIVGQVGRLEKEKFFRKAKNEALIATLTQIQLFSILRERLCKATIVLRIEQIQISSEEQD